MTSEIGLAHVKSRLLSCPDLASLRRVWDGLGYDYVRHPDIIALKDQLKMQYEAKKGTIH